MLRILRVSNPVVNALGKILRANKKPSVVIAAIYFLVTVNRYLSKGARNNWTKDKYSWAEETVLITGGSSGIGEKLVLRLAARGLKVVVLDLSPLAVAVPKNVHFFRCDVTSRSDVSEVGKRIREVVGNPTILVNNAGVVRNASILDKQIKDVEFTFAVNTFSHYNTVQEFLPSMIQRKHGHILTTASLAAHISSPLVSDYQMSKAACLAFHETLGTELKHIFKCPEIRTSVIMPGYVATPLHKDNAFGKETNPLIKAAVGADEVAARIEDVIMAGDSATIVVPGRLTLLTATRAMSEWLQRAVMDHSAVSMLTE